MNDETLMDAVRAGDLAQLGVLFERHHAALFGFLCRTTGDRAVAQDLVQEVFERLLKYRATYRQGSPFEAWLFRIARNARADYFNRREARQAEQQAQGPEPILPPDEHLERERDAVRLQRALMLLPDDKRDLIVLARYRALRQEQIAELLGVEVGAVRTRLHRAMAQLREIFLRLSACAAESKLPSTGVPCDAKNSGHNLSII
jgi:RNA polymerase sigma factor (sigma-70 family)